MALNSLGHTATHAVVYASLIIHGKRYGVHPFMVQLRSLEDHRPLTGFIPRYENTFICF